MASSSTAEQVAGGRLVMTRIAERMVVGINAIRNGKDFVNHYFVPLDPLPEGALTLVYIDYTVEMQDCHSRFSLELDPVENCPRADVGHVVANATGNYLKVQEPIKGSMSLGYVDLATGEVRRRQERDVSGIFQWRLTTVGGDPRKGAFAAIRNLFGKS